MRYREAEAVKKISDWESKSGHVLWPEFATVPGTGDALHSALRAGHLIAYGLKATGGFEPIPSIEWERLRPTSHPRFHHPYVRILVETKSVQKLWPKEGGRKQFPWDKIRSWYPELIGDRLGKRKGAREILARYEREIGNPLPSESVIEKDIAKWKRGHSHT